LFCGGGASFGCGDGWDGEPSAAGCCGASAEFAGLPGIGSDGELSDD
jgi:hypothetical protein